jgi:hypothetical protein
MKLLVDVAAVNDVPMLREDRNLPLEICVPEDRTTVRKMAGLVAEVLRAFDYERSPEFEEAVAGESSAVVAMKRRLASDSVKRVEQQQRLETALGDVLSRDAVYMLVPKEHHMAIRNLVELATRLRNPIDGDRGHPLSDQG